MLFKPVLAYWDHAGGQVVVWVNVNTSVHDNRNSCNYKVIVLTKYGANDSS